VSLPCYGKATPQMAPLSISVFHFTAIIKLT